MDLQRTNSSGEACFGEVPKRRARGRLRRKALPILFSSLLAIVAWRDLRPLLGHGKGAARPVASHTLAEPGVELTHGGHPRRASPELRSGSRLAMLRLTELDRLPIDSRATRDPWRFVDPPPRARRASQNPIQVLTHSVQSRKLAEEPIGPRPAEFTLRYLGSFGTPETKVAVFTDGKRQLNLLEGGVIDGQFRVTRVGREFVDIQFVGFPGCPAQRLGLRWR